MKGIAHFVTGVALATFFPEVMEKAADGSLLPVLGGVAGILPDTLDFKFVRYFERYDVEIDPGPEPNASAIAARLAGAMRQAYESDDPQRVKLHTIRLGADLWRRYTVRFDPDQSQVTVHIGPAVSTAQVPLPGSEPAEAEKAHAEIDVPLINTYDDEIEIDIFSGPSFTFERRNDQLRVHFLAWHRRWSHSLTLAAALGLLSGLIFGQWVGLVIGLGLLGHILEDQLGHMGSNLLYPFTRDRTAGLQLFHSGDGVPNFLAVWIAVALTVFNMDRFAAQPRLNPRWFLGLAVALPLVTLGGAYWWRRQGRSRPEEALRQREIMSEAEDVDIG